MFELKSCRIIGPQSSVLVQEDFVWIKTDTFLWRHDFVKIYYFWIVPSQISQNLFLEFFSKKICRRYELKPLKKCKNIWTLSRSSVWGEIIKQVILNNFHFVKFSHLIQNLKRKQGKTYRKINERNDLNIVWALKVRYWTCLGIKVYWAKPTFTNDFHTRAFKICFCHVCCCGGNNLLGIIFKKMFLNLRKLTLFCKWCSQSQALRLKSPYFEGILVTTCIEWEVENLSYRLLSKKQAGLSDWPQRTRLLDTCFCPALKGTFSPKSVVNVTSLCTYVTNRSTKEMTYFIFEIASTEDFRRFSS